MAFVKRVAVVIGAVVIVVGAVMLWKNGTNAAISEHASVVKVESVEQQKQPTSNAQKITESDWHPVGSFYFVRGSVSKVETRAFPADVKGPVWTDVVVTIDSYVNSKVPETQDGSMRVGGTSLITFYDLVDKGQNHLHEGDQVIIKCAEYTTPAGKIVWGSKYDDIYYKTNKGYVNNKGDVIS